VIETGLNRAAAHIMIILHDFSTGGTERVAIRLAARWVAAGRRVTILCGNGEGPARGVLDPRVTVHSVDPEIRRGALSRWRLATAFVPAVRRLRPDLIFVPGNFHLPIAGRLADLLGDDRVPMICKLSNPLRGRKRSAAHQWLFERAVLRPLAARMQGFVAMSESLRAEAARLLPAAPLELIDEPILDADSDCRGQTDRNAPLILCIGRLVPQKNFLLAIRALASLSPVLGARLLILGEGGQRGALEREAARLGVADRVCLGGHVTDVRPALASARLLLITSEYEGYPAVAIEALAAGRPVVTTACSPAIGEILSHPSFGRITPADPSAIAAAVIATLDAPFPDGAALAPLAARHQVETAAARYLDLFDRTVREPAQPEVPPCLA